MNAMVGIEWLYNRLDQEELRVIDCRFSLADPDKGKTEYEQGHIPRAIYFDLEKDLSGPVGEHGGRHPLPELDKLKDKLERAGINEQTTLVAYDNGEGAFAARFWWMLTYLGHSNVYVLNGGYKAWLNADYSTTTEVPLYEKTHFSIHLQPQLLADVKEVREVVSGGIQNTVLIDSREEKRYLGIEEPIDKKKGHIPGAINKPWLEGLHDGHFKSIDEQRKRFSDLDSKQQFIVYCGSGVTAAPNYLALKEAGFEHVKLYLGSFSDWISYDENKIN